MSINKGANILHFCDEMQLYYICGNEGNKAMQVKRKNVFPCSLKNFEKSEYLCTSSRVI